MSRPCAIHGEYAITIEGRKQLRHLIDVVWNHVTESEEVPSTLVADELIDKALKLIEDA